MHHFSRSRDNRSRVRVHAASAALAIVALVFITGCETPGASAPRNTPTEYSTPTAPVAKESPGLTPRQRIRRALELLEVGDEPTARAELTAYRRSVPNSSLAKDLIAQIDRPVDEYFPTEYQVITLKPGQTLSNVSQTYLGSAYKFYALAKYNKISKPRRVVPGQSIKIPLTSSAIAAFEDDDSNEADVIVDERSIAEQLETDDEIQEELENVVETEAVQLEPGTVDPDAAFEVDSEVADSEPMDGVDPVEIPIDSEVEAEGALVGSEELVDEIDQAEQLTEDTVDDAAAELMARQQEVSQLHRSAISAYRAQDLDKAIALWNEVLLLDPEHEGAQIYREQAVSLKQRLDSLN